MKQIELQNKNLLIVDDDTFFLELIKLMVKNLGFKNIEVATSYEEAITLIESKVLDLALLDIELGNDRSGIDVAQYIQTNQPDLPVVFLTATAYDEVMYEKARKTNPFGFLDKTLSPMQLRQAIELPLKVQQRNTQKLREQEKKAIEQNKQLKAEFISSMNHQIRTPMNSIVGLTELLLQSAPSQFQETLKDLQFAGDNLMKLLKDIIELSRLKQGQTKLKAEQFSLREHLNTLIERIQNSNENSAVEIALEFTGLPLQNQIVGDVEQLINILDHLLDNALKFTKSGSIDLSVKVENIIDHHVYLYFEVCDTGIGIEAERLPYIFESFSEVDNVKEKQFAGSGLGLSIAKLLVKLHASNLKVKSKTGMGSAFFFTAKFPLGTAIESPQIEQLAGLNVLLVEDNLLNQRLAQKALEKKGMLVTTANHGQAALDLMESKIFDVILMDINVPIVDGMTTSEHIRNLKDVKSSTPIILVTATKYEQVSEEIDRLSLNGHLGKPFKPTELYSAIYRAIYIGM